MTDTERNAPLQEQPDDDTTSGETYETSELDRARPIDGGGIGHVSTGHTMSEIGVMSGGAGSEVGAIGDFDRAGQADYTAHRGVGGSSLDTQSVTPEVDAETGLSGQTSRARNHPDGYLRPDEAADDAHSGAAFPTDAP
jgi:hypothetical protein